MCASPCSSRWGAQQAASFGGFLPVIQGHGDSTLGPVSAESSPCQAMQHPRLAVRDRKLSAVSQKHPPREVVGRRRSPSGWGLRVANALQSYPGFGGCSPPAPRLVPRVMPRWEPSPRRRGCVPFPATTQVHAWGTRPKDGTGWGSVWPLGAGQPLWYRRLRSGLPRARPRP